MLKLGTKAPEFELYDTVSGQQKSLNQLKGTQGTLVMFICNHCPFVKHVNPEIVRLATYYQKKGISVIAISSNDVDKQPEDSPEKMKETAEKLNYPFPYLYDETQETAKAYKAACTPDFYLFNAEMKLTYRGRLDESTPGNNKPSNGQDLRQALDLLLEGKILPDEEQHASIGCSIKWKHQ